MTFVHTRTVVNGFFHKIIYLKSEQPLRLQNLGPVYMEVEEPR